MSRNLLAFACIFFITACANFAPPTFAPTYEIQNGKPDDRVIYTTQDKRVTFDIHSPSGISRAQIKQTSGAAPQQITLNLHLKALEHFKFSFANQAVEIEIPTTGSDHTPRESVPPDSSLYMPVKIISQDNAYPLQNGYIQIELPRAYYESGAREFSIEWIDFYR